MKSVGSAVVLTAFLHHKILRRKPAEQLYIHQHGELLIEFQGFNQLIFFLNPVIIFNSYILLS